MLEFETDKAFDALDAKLKAPTGYVVIKLEDYNNLLMRASAGLPIKVERISYCSTIEARLDEDYIYKAAMKALHEKFSEEELANYAICGPDETYVGGITLAHKTEEPKIESDHVLECDEA